MDLTPTCTIQRFNFCTSRPDVCQCTVCKHQWITCQIKPIPPMGHVACKSKLHSFVRSSMHPCQGKWVAIGCAVVCHSLASHAFSPGIICRHCTRFDLGCIELYNLCLRPKFKQINVDGLQAVKRILIKPLV